MKLLKSYSLFDSFRQEMRTERDQLGAIHAFKNCYELALRMMKRALESRGQEVGSPKDTFRKAVLEKLIDDPELWFEFQKKRNLTSHTYEHENVVAILSIFDRFSSELAELINRLEALE